MRSAYLKAEQGEAYEPPHGCTAMQKTELQSLPPIELQSLPHIELQSLPHIELQSLPHGVGTLSAVGCEHAHKLSYPWKAELRLVDARVSQNGSYALLAKFRAL
eukprot:323421-Pleurochrysis_carterae.AAC.1